MYEPQHELSNNVVCATSKASDQQGICAVWQKPLVVAWIFYDCSATDQTVQEVFHVYLNKFENAVTHLFLVILVNN